ncbi:hypothetical protein MHH33_12810 [Paenisporosarcina sp. FSL H8-0542]
MRKKISLLCTALLLSLGLCLPVSAEDDMPGPKSVDIELIVKQSISNP